MTRQHPSWTRNAQWKRNFNALKKYLRTHHDGEYPTQGDSSGLGTWIKAQRTAYKQPKNTKRKYFLSKDKINKLESLPGWAWKAHDAQWKRNFNALKEYVIGHDGKYPTQGDSSGLYSWIRRQREAYKQPKNTDLKPLSDDQIEKLESLRGWSWNAHGVRWNRNFNALKKYVIDHNGEYPTQGDPSGLGRWIHTQRQAYKRTENTKRKPLSDDQINKLESLPRWTWKGKFN